jgi:hypothetical protein
MPETTTAALEFPIGWCAACARHVLTHADPEADGAQGRLCVHCDAPIDAELRAVEQGELDAHGYAVIENYNCGNPNCGGGRCGKS